MAAIAAERNLLFGLLALQNGLINQGQLVAAFQAWTLDKARALADHLVGRGDLDADDRSAVEALVARHLKKHGGDVERSLAAIPAGRSTRESLARIDDPAVGGTLAHLGSASTQHGEEADRTTSYAVGEATSAGQRFRILRPHARGGLGAVFVALDSELHREVALKQILDRHADDPASRQRFLVEAEVTGGLEHPGIVPVYGLGTYGDGRPFYAMRFIRGDSLKEAIEHFHADDSLKNDPGRRSLELRRLLRRFTDVCNAIEYAHSRGVLHRDIKPGNIIVGKHGETLVVDWGLAKATGKAAPGAEERTLMPSSASGSAETLPGSALGTPAYMSPEQARGELESLGPQSDIYSLGATLYCLLTGRPPLEGDDIGELLRQVQRGEFPPPRQIEGSIDAALEAVCLKAMASQPADRYATPKALAEDIERWMADEPVTAHREPVVAQVRRWMRRRRTAVTAVAAAAFVGVIGLAAVLAVQARANADLKTKNDLLTAANARTMTANVDLRAANERERARFNLAMDAVKLFHGEVSEDLLLKEKQFEGLRTKLLRGAAEFYNKLEDLLKRHDDLTSRTALGLAYYELGELTDAIGSKPAALDVHRKALAVRRELAVAPKAAAATKADVARSLIAVGQLQASTGDTSGALASYEEARGLAEGVAATVSAADTLRSLLALVYDHIGRLLRARPAEALAACERAKAILEALADANPNTSRLQSDLARSHSTIGVLLQQSGRPAEALAAFERARAILQELTEAYPDITQYQKDRGLTEKRIGWVLWQRGRPAEALAAFERARAILQELTDAYPNVTGFQEDLAFIHEHIGHVLRYTSRPYEALAAYGRARAILQKLVDANPSITLFQSELAVNLFSIGGLQQKAVRTAEAAASVRQGLAIMERLPGSEPHNHYNLACAHALLARIASEPGSGMGAAEGQAEADRAMDSLRRAVAAGYGNLTHMRVDPDLDPLRSRPDFQMLLMDLAFPIEPFARGG